jgi:hypothetical protein
MSEKTLNVFNTNDARARISDIEVKGNPDIWILVCKASSSNQGWMKSTKVLNAPNGCFLQASTQQMNPDGTYSVAESVTFAPGINYVDGEFKAA